ncbi:MAG: PaaI family thioesterase, partial [Pseudomonadota bacterium]
LGIDDYKLSNLKSHFRKLERMYLSAACNDYYEPGISISEGMAQVVIPVRKKLFHAAGSVHGSVYFKAMDDAACFAVNSFVQDVCVMTVNFNIYLTRPVSAGRLVARGRFMGVSGHHYMAEAVLADEKGKEIGRGQGAFVRSKIPLTPEMGYK